MNNTQTANAYALITGGSAGIGLELSKLFGKDGFNLVLVSKPEDELKTGKETLASMFPDIDIRTIQKDLSVQGSAQEVYDEVKAAGLEVDILVNNAGFATYGDFRNISIERELDMINLNVVTLYHLTRLFLADMVAKDRGRILNVSSTAGLYPVPHFTTYAATKAFSRFFSEALDFELKHTKSSVNITTLCPPPVRTGFQKASGMENSTLFNKSVAMDAPEVAEEAYQALFQGETTIIPSRAARISFKIVALLPKKIRPKALMDSLK